MTTKHTLEYRQIWDKIRTDNGFNSSETCLYIAELTDRSPATPYRWLNNIKEPMLLLIKNRLAVKD